MLRKYSIHKEGSPLEDAVAYLYYDEETRKYSIDIICKDKKKPMPALMWFALDINKYHLDDDVAKLFVREHIIPPDRAGMDYILKELGFPYYDEILFLDKFKGRSVMDDFLIERVE